MASAAAWQAVAAFVGAGTAVHTATSGKGVPKLPKVKETPDVQETQKQQMRDTQRKYAGAGRRGTKLAGSTALG